MLAKPRDERVSRRIFEQVNDTVSTHVHQNRALSASPAQRKFIDTKNRRRRDWPFWKCPYHAQQCAAAGWHR
jgi:hypothetical protein